MSKKKLLTIVAATVLSLSALPAMADDHVSFGISFGNEGRHGGFRESFYEGHRGHGWGHGWGHERGWGHHEYRSNFYGYNPFFEQRRVVYIEQPRVIERQIIMQEPETINANAGRIVSNNPYCREYQRNVVVGGHREESYGTACRQPDGAWKIVSE